MRLLWYVSRRSQPSTASPEVGMAFLISKWARMPMTSQVNGTKNGCIMKNFNKIFFAAVAAAFGLASCSQELTPVEKPQGNLVTVNFGAEASITCPTKATLTTEDEKLFTSAWENGDALSVKYSFDYGASKETTATWSADKSCFEAQMEGGNGVWIYDALYPTPKEVSFGSERTQNGSNYNGKYDLMYGSATAEGADAGKTADGKNVVFEMTRQTAVAYFHLTGTLDEEVVSAKLSVEGDGAYISTSDVKANEDYAKGYVFTETEGVASKEINLTFDAGTAPKASDFKLWFNVLPTTYAKMTLSVETTGYTMTISRNASETDKKYESGKLYKVVKAIPADKWIKKGGFAGGDLLFNFKTSKPVGWPINKETTGGTYKYTVDGIDYDFILGTGVYCAGATPNSAYILIPADESLGLPAIKGYKLVKVVGTLNDAGNPSLKANISITDGEKVISGGAAQTWTTKGADYTYTLTETKENTVYYMSVSTKNCQMIKLVLSFEAAAPSAPKCAAPVITIDEAGVVSISCATAGATIHYTTGDNPADPTESDAVFSAVTLTDGQTIKAIAVAEGYQSSAVASKKYTVNVPEPKSYEWVLTTKSDAWTNNGCVTYFTQPYGIKKVNAYIVNKSISDFANASKISISVKSLCNGATTSQLTIYLVDANGKAIGEGKVITPDNKSQANQTTYKEVVFDSVASQVTGMMVKCTKFGKNVLINGVKYTVTY